jgi:hypothetical protein
MGIADEKEAQVGENLCQQLEAVLSLQEQQPKVAVEENSGSPEGPPSVVELNEGPSSAVEPNEGGSQQVATAVVTRVERPLLPSIGLDVNDSRMTLARFKTEFQKFGITELCHDWHGFNLPVSVTRPFLFFC